MSRKGRKAAALIAGGLGLMAASFATDSDANGGTVEATYYDSSLEGQPTASGEPFRSQGFTAAHPTLPFGTLLKVTHEGQSVQVRVNDRPDANTSLDLSEGAADAIGLKDEGRGAVAVEQTSSIPVTTLPATGGPPCC